MYPPADWWAAQAARAKSIRKGIRKITSPGANGTLRAPATNLFNRLQPTLPCLLPPIANELLTSATDLGGHTPSIAVSAVSFVQETKSVARFRLSLALGVDC